MRLLHSLPLILLSTLLCGMVLVAADMFTDDRSSLVLKNSSYVTISALDGIRDIYLTRSITMWVKLYQTDIDQVLYSQNEVSFPCNNLDFSIGYSASDRTFFISSCDFSIKNLGPANISVEANKWFHVAMVWTPLAYDAVGQVFVNGFGGVSGVHWGHGVYSRVDRLVLGHRVVATRDGQDNIIGTATSGNMSGEIGQINIYNTMELTQEQIQNDMITGIAATGIMTTATFGVNNQNRTYSRSNQNNDGTSAVTFYNGAYVHVLGDVIPGTENNKNNTNTNTNTSTTTNEPATTKSPAPPPAATSTSAPTKIPTDSDTIVVRSISFEVYWISRVTPPVDTSIARELYGVMRSLASQVNIAQTDVVIDLDDIYRVKGTKDSNKGYWHIEVSFKGLKQTATIEKALFTQKLFTLPNAANTKDDGKSPLSGLGMDQQAVVENLHYMSEQSCPDGTTIAASETCAGIRDSSATATQVSLMLIPFTIASSWILSLF